MYLRTLTLLAVSGALAWGGYGVSLLRSAPKGATISDVLAAAGSEPGFFSSSDPSNDNANYRISALTVFSNVALHVKDNYVDPERINPKEMLVAALREIERQVAEVLVEDEGQGRLKVRVMDHENTVYIDDVESLWEINLKLREVFRFFENHLPPRRDKRTIEYAAVNGALSTLDPHSVLLKPEAFAEMKTSTKGEFGGLGIVISVRDAKLTIISPLDGTPASRAGLKAGDVISRIGEVSTVSMPIEEAVQMLRGPEGSKVTIWVDRKSWTDSRKFNIIRERIKIQSVESQLLKDKVGYIKIKNFQQKTGKDLEKMLNKLAKKSGGKLNGLVLDLRNNPGGLLEQAIQVSDKFLTSGDIVTTVGYGNKLREPKRARWSGTESELPIAVLVNKGSASASEIVAGALKNLNRAIVIGERTFGKGSVQVLYDFNDNSALKLTIAQYLTPGGISIQNEGVTPDIELKPALLDENTVRLFYEPEGHREKNLNKHLDRAGEKAIPENTPKHRIKYLIDRPKDKDKDRDPNAFREDYQITFARELLTSIGDRSRPKIIERSKSFVLDRKKAEETKLIEQMSKLGVNWSKGPSAAGAKVSAKMNVIKGLKDGKIPAGSEVELTATVTNTSQTPLYRLRGQIRSENGAFLGREFLFGKLNAGETREWKVKTKIPKESPSRNDELTLKLESDAGPLTDETKISATVQKIGHPQFAYTYGFEDESRGDGDGVLEVGEGVDFAIYVTNTGKGDADDVSLRLKSAAKENLFLERGRMTIGAIKAGETKVGKLRFRVPDAQHIADQKLMLELTIYDAGTGEWLEDQFPVVAKTPKKHRLSKRVTGVLAKRNTLLFTSAAADSEVLATVLKGARFVTNAKTNGFYRVQLQDGALGWLKAKDVSKSSKPKAAPISQLTFHPARKPPRIELTPEIGGRVINTETLKLTGKISARMLRDMYVLLNDRKVHFAIGPVPKTSEEAPATQGWEPPDDAAVQLPFSVDLKLKEGLNKILVVARSDEKVITYRNLYISRRPLSGSTVAKATESKKTSGSN